MPLVLALRINRRYIAGMSETSFKTPQELQSVLGARLRKLRLSRPPTKPGYRKRHCAIWNQGMDLRLKRSLGLLKP